MITSNQIKIELQKPTLTSIIIQTGIYLNELPLAPEQMTALYTRFQQDNGIADQIPILEPQAKLESRDRGTSKRSNNQRRRKRRQKNYKSLPTTRQICPAEPFFISRPQTDAGTSLTVHNLSNVTLSPEELSKGLSFTPTPKLPLTVTYVQVLRYFNSYAKTLRQKYIHAQYHAYT